MAQPTPEQLEQVREVVGESSRDVVRAALAALDDAAWARTLLDLAEWESVRSEHARLSGGREGLDVDPARQRQAIRERVRVRLGLPVRACAASTWVPVQLEL
ncbi:MAG: hypothetical protein IRY83_13260 [Chloroflexi bacterium]|nr:hypothetical protein [Chloroflexota bacterium]